MRPEAPSGQAYIQGVERLVTGILQAIFGGNANRRLRLRRKIDANFLPLDHIGGPKRRSAARKPARGASGEREQLSSRKRS